VLAAVVLLTPRKSAVTYIIYTAGIF
jgi:hypothetical protein